ncbi:hypothetical protein [Butyrivibrio sp. VCD2006]|uniref:hypothetical protein n=1 Tax=Butyrivibrio sp. VCD2006 TaxID=1280664 RepID=UPI00040216D5|nr:hypothetical protein [Butyrivibrio sp. VCD2006]
MANGIFRDKSMDNISSPEQLNDYLKVTKPSVWVVLFAIILLLIGLFIWSSFAYITSSVEGVADVKEGKMTVHFTDDDFSENLKEGMEIVIGDTKIPITSIGRDDDGHVFAVADTKLDDGSYHAFVHYKKTQVLRLLFDE